MASGIDIKIGTLFDKSGITEANKSLARLAQDVKSANGNLRESASAAGLDMAREADKACLAQVGAYAKVEKKVVDVAAATTAVGETAKVAGSEASKSFASLEMILGLCRGSTEQVAKAVAALSEKFPALAKIGVGTLGAIGAAVASVISLASALKDLIVTVFNLDAVPKEVREIHLKFVDLNNAAELFKVKMNEAREVAEKQKKIYDEEVDAINRMTKAQNELKRAQELSLAVTQEQKDEINRRYDSANADADETAAQDKRDNERRSLMDERFRIQREIKQAQKQQAEYEKLFANGGQVGTDEALAARDTIERKNKELQDNQRKLDALDREDELAQTLIETRKVKEETAAVEAEEKREEEAKKAAAKIADEQKRMSEEKKREELKQIEEINRERIKAEQELHKLKVDNLKDEIDKQKSAADSQKSVASAAQTEFDRAFAMYRDPEQAAAQIAEERDYAADYKQLQRDASRYGGKWRIDELSRLMAAGDTAGQAAKLEEWRKSSRFTPEVEAMVRAAAADKTRTTAEDELRKLNKTTEETKTMLENLLTMKG